MLMGLGVDRATAGDLFGFVKRKERLREDEAKFLFRQILLAVKVRCPRRTHRERERDTQMVGER
jgi:hypothetical protein